MLIYGIILLLIIQFKQGITGLAHFSGFTNRGKSGVNNA